MNQEGFFSQRAVLSERGDVVLFTNVLPISIFDLGLSAIFGVILIGAKSLFEKSNKDNIIATGNFY